MTGGADNALDFPDFAKLELDELIDQLVLRAQGVKRAQGRLRALLRAIETVTGDLALEPMLRNLVEAACELAQAEYAALGVIAPAGGLEQFVHVGMPDDAVSRIGHLPEGNGLLGALITDPRPIRLEHMSDDPRSTGFPPGHPPMDSFLGVPLRVRDEVFGNLYLSNSRRGAFTAEDEQLMIALALAAGTAISHARLYQESRTQQRWLEASAEIGAQLFAATGEDPLKMISRRALDLGEADLAALGLVDESRTHIVVEAAFGIGGDELVGRRIDLATSFGGRVVDSGEPLLLTSPAEDPERVLQIGAALEAGPIMVVPLRGTGEVRGTLSLVRREGRRPFTATEVTMVAGFAAHASVALELADVRAAEKRLVLLEDRDRIARDLHDHVIQEMFAIGLSLEGMATQLGPDSPLGRRATQRVEDIDRTIRRIRTSIFELRGELGSTTGGLRERILEVTSELTPILGVAPHVTFAGLVDIRGDDDLRDDVLACVREGLTNVAKHAHARSVSVDVSDADGQLTVTITDDGIGCGEVSRSSGTANLRVRAERRGGIFELGSAASRGTILRWSVPTG